MSAVARWTLILLLLLAHAGDANAHPAASAPLQEGDPGRVTEMRDRGELDPVEARRLRFLFWAYTAIWILLSVYLVSLWVRLGSVRKELHRLQDRLGQGSRS